MTSSPQTSFSWKSRLDRSLPLIALAATALFALSETAAVRFFSAPPAKGASWQAASAYVHKHFRKGDLILFVPEWIDPVGRKFMGDLLTLDQVSRPDTDTYGRIWVVGPRGRHAPLTARRHPRLSKHRLFGRLDVRLFEQKPVTSVYDFYKQVRKAQVALLDKKGTIVERCPWSETRRRHQCRAGWNNVRRKLAEIDYHLRRCIYAHPHEGRILRISFAHATLGSRLVVYTGLDNYASRYKARKAVLDAKKKHPGSPKARLVDVTMKVFADNYLLGSIRQPVDEAWHRHVLKTTAGNDVSVRFEVTTKNAYGKVFCFYARAER